MLQSVESIVGITLRVMKSHHAKRDVYPKIMRTEANPVRENDVSVGKAPQLLT